MTQFQFILLQGSLFFALYMCIHQIYLGKSKSFQYNRWALLLLPLIAFGAPFIFNNTSFFQSETLHFNFAPILLENAIVQQTNVREAVAHSSSFDWGKILAYCWFAGFLLCLTKLGYDIVKILSILLKQNKQDYNGFLLYLSENEKNAWTYFRHIVIPSSLSASEKEMVLLHESTHAKQLHSCDILFAQLIKAIFWWNPFVYLWNKAIKDNHEFIADAIVVEKHSIKSYGELMLNSHFETKSIRLANTFMNKYKLKTRIMMMKKESKIGKVATVIATAILTVSFVGIAGQQNGKKANAIKTSVQDVPVKLAPKDSVYTHVDQMPMFPGGIDSMNVFVVKNFKYPKNDGKTTGVIYTSFVVRKNGSITDVKIARGLNEAFDKEAIRVVKSMPKWTPGEKNGKRVNVQFVLPIRITN